MREEGEFLLLIALHARARERGQKEEDLTKRKFPSSDRKGKY